MLKIQIFTHKKQLRLSDTFDAGYCRGTVIIEAETHILVPVSNSVSNCSRNIFVKLFRLHRIPAAFWSSFEFVLFHAWFARSNYICLIVGGIAGIWHLVISMRHFVGLGQCYRPSVSPLGRLSAVHQRADLSACMSGVIHLRVTLVLEVRPVPHPRRPPGGSGAAPRSVQPPSTVHGPLSTVHCPVSTVNYPLPTVHCPR